MLLYLKYKRNARIFMKIMLKGNRSATCLNCYLKRRRRHWADAHKEVNRISGKTGMAEVTPVFLSVVPVWQVESGFSPHR